MAGEGFIETGVDKLVRLVEQKQRLSIQDAAKALGVTSAVVEEWANFLEEEGLISLEYKLATTYLVERKLTKKEVIKKAKEFHGSKEAFVRKIESALQTIERDSSGLESLKKNFVELRDGLGSELKNVQDELKQLEGYEKLKKGIDKQMLEQQEDFKKRIVDMDKELFRERSKYKELLDDIDVERVRLAEEKSEMVTLREQEAKLLKKLDGFKKEIGKVRRSIEDEENRIGVTEEHIQYFEKLSEKIKVDIKEYSSKLEPLAKESKSQHEKIMRLQDEIMQKVTKGAKKIKGQVKDSSQVAAKFKMFLDKKTQIEGLLSKVDKEKLDLENELQNLIKKAHGFNLASKQSSVKAHISELNKKYEEIEKKRDSFKSEINKLIKLVRSSF